MATYDPGVYQNLFSALRAEEDKLRGATGFAALDQEIRGVTGATITGVGGYEELCELLRTDGYADEKLAAQLKVTALSEPIYENGPEEPPSCYKSKDAVGSEIYSADPFADADEWSDAAPDTAQPEEEPDEAAADSEWFYDEESGRYYNAAGEWYEGDDAEAEAEQTEQAEQTDQAQTPAPRAVGEPEAIEAAKRFLGAHGIDIDATLAGIDSLLGAGAAS